MWSGGPAQTAGLQVSGAQSYFCIYGKESAVPHPTTVTPIMARATEDPVGTATSHSTIPVLPNPTVPPRAPQSPCGSLGTIDKQGNTDQLPTYSDQQYYVEDGSIIT
jgi:hypothetical protein